jgi:metallo-beta-lactamase class B
VRIPAGARRVLPYLLLPLIPAVILLGKAWKAAGDEGGQTPADPFRIADNFYYVGASDASAFLITGPEGHVLLDGGFPGTPPLIMASIAKLGFNIKDVKILINSDPYKDQAGGLAELQQASGGQLWSNDASAITLSSGGDDPALLLPLRTLIWIGVLSYPPARVDHIFKDGDVVRLGPLALTAHITGGHSRGCTSWSFQTHDGNRTLDVVSACSLEVLPAGHYPEQKADIVRSLQVLRSLPCDIWVTARARRWSRYPKFLASQRAKNPVDAFIDPDGYRSYINDAEAAFQRDVVHEQAR